MNRMFGQYIISKEEIDEVADSYKDYISSFKATKDIVELCLFTATKSMEEYEKKKENPDCKDMYSSISILQGQLKIVDDYLSNIMNNIENFGRPCNGRKVKDDS